MAASRAMSMRLVRAYSCLASTRIAASTVCCELMADFLYRMRLGQHAARPRAASSEPLLLGRRPDLWYAGRMGTREGDGYAELVAIMRKLLSPEGCPWDREQTLESLRP